MDRKEAFREAGRQIMEELYESSGITEEYLGRKTRELLEAQKITPIKVKVGLLDNARKVFTDDLLPDGYEVIKKTSDEWLLALVSPDYNIQVKALANVHRVRGDYQDRQELSGSIQITPQLDPEQREFIEKLGEKVVKEIVESHFDRIRSDG